MRLSVSLRKLLILFLTRCGKLITREEIAQVLWEGSNTVDVTTGINMAVRRLRALLDDDPVSPTYIETIIGLGYRFIAVVEEIETSGSPKGVEASRNSISTEQATSAREGLTASDSNPAAMKEQEPPSAMASENSIQIRFYWRVFFVLSASLLILGVGTILVRHKAVHSVHSGEEQLFFKQLPTQVTFSSDDKISVEAIAPDGHSVAYSDGSSISIHSLENGADRLLASPSSFFTEHLAWYPDGGSLLASGVDIASRRSLVWVVSLRGEPPRLLLNDAGLAAINSDRNRIVYTRQRGAEVWIADGDGQNERLLVPQKNGESFTFLLWSPRSNRVVVNRRHAVPPVRSGSSSSDSPSDLAQSRYRWIYESIDAVTGRVLAQEENIQFDSAFLLQDGRFFFPVLGSSGKSRLRMVATNPDSGRFLKQPQAEGSLQGWDAAGVDSIISLSASADGNVVGAVLARHTVDVYVAEIRKPGLTLAGITRLTDHSQSNYPHAWTPNGDAVVFDSANNGRSLICKQQLHETKMEIQAELPDKAAMAEFTSDGKWMMFIEFTGWPTRAIGIFSIPVEGGKPKQLYTTGTIDEFHCPIASKAPCVLRETIAKDEFVFFALDPVRGMEQELGRIKWQPTILGDWSISPDGSAVVLANHDPNHPSLQVATLTARSLSSMTTIPVVGFGTMLEPIWSPDGKGFFVELKTAAGYDLLFVDRAGHAKVLRESPIPIWGTPSRDGRKLAFPGETITKNVWVDRISLR